MSVEAVCPGITSRTSSLPARALLYARCRRLPDLLLPHNKCQRSARRMAINAIAAVITMVITYSFLPIVITAIVNRSFSEDGMISRSV